MKYIVPTTIYLALFLAAGYLILRFFSSLSGVDMFKAFLWGFKAKRFEIVIPLMLFYLIAFVFFLAIITTPLFMSTAKITQKGGLLGYQDDDYIYRYYEPLQGKYLEVKHYNPPPASRQFIEAFSVVSFYKPLFSSHYQNVFDLSLTVSIIKIIFFLIGVIPFYFILFLSAKEFGRQSSPSQKITHKLISGNFTEITRLNVLAVIIAVIIIIAISTISGFIVSRNISRGHKKVYSGYSAEYQAKIAQKVTPGKMVTGRVIRRESILIKHYTGRFENGEISNKSTVKYTPAKIYTIEFSDILKMPVYLNLELIENDELKPFIGRLDELFGDKKSSVPHEKKDMEFMVNKDFSLSLPGQEQQD